jgi:hypothetical protein
MRNMTKRGFVIGLVIGVFALAICSVQAAKVKTEDELITMLASAKEKEVIGAMQEMEKHYSTSAKCQAALKPFLTDRRMPVRRKAARVLGIMNADLNEAQIKSICELLTSPDKYAVIDGLKALRGLKAQSAIPEIAPLLKNSDKNVIRDACRTLAVLGNKSLIPEIAPLLQHADPAVEKDAADAIAILKEK